MSVRLPSWTRPSLPVATGKRRLVLRAAIVLAALVGIYFGPVPLLIQHIDDSADFGAASPQPGQSLAVATAIALIEREIHTHSWTPNDPWFFPTAALDNMPNFQLGIISGVSRFVIELGDRVARSRGSSPIDPDIEDAAGRLKFPGTAWYLDLSVSIVPQSPAEAQYDRAMQALMRYNRRLAAGEAVFERRADNLIAVLERVLADIGSDSAVIDEAVDRAWILPFGWTHDDLFYRIKGRLYANHLILRDLGEDFSDLIRTRESKNLWDQMLSSLSKGAGYHPLIILNGQPDHALFMNHLSGLGFYLLRARTQLKEIANTLLK